MATHELFNVPDDAGRASALALTGVTPNEDEGYHTWLSTAGYPFMIPSSKGVAMATEFNMIYGDDICLLPADKGKAMIKRKYWKYFSW